MVFDLLSSIHLRSFHQRCLRSERKFSVSIMISLFLIVWEACTKQEYQVSLLYVVGLFWPAYELCDDFIFHFAWTQSSPLFCWQKSAKWGKTWHQVDSKADISTKDCCSVFCVHIQAKTTITSVFSGHVAPIKKMITSIYCINSLDFVPGPSFQLWLTS